MSSSLVNAPLHADTTARRQTDLHLRVSVTVFYNRIILNITTPPSHSLLLAISINMQHAKNKEEKKRSHRVLVKDLCSFGQQCMRPTFDP